MNAPFVRHGTLCLLRIGRYSRQSEPTSGGIVDEPLGIIASDLLRSAGNHALSKTAQARLNHAVGVWRRLA